MSEALRDAEDEIRNLRAWAAELEAVNGNLAHEIKSLQASRSALQLETVDLTAEVERLRPVVTATREMQRRHNRYETRPCSCWLCLELSHIDGQERSRTMGEPLRDQKVHIWGDESGYELIVQPTANGGVMLSIAINSLERLGVTLAPYRARHLSTLIRSHQEALDRARQEEQDGE